MGTRCDGAKDAVHWSQGQRRRRCAARRIIRNVLEPDVRRGSARNVNDDGERVRETTLTQGGVLEHFKHVMFYWALHRRHKPKRRRGSEAYREACLHKHLDAARGTGDEEYLQDIFRRRTAAS